MQARDSHHRQRPRPQAHPLPHDVAASSGSPFRQLNLRLLLDASGGNDNFTNATGLTPSRVTQLLEGAAVINDEMVVHLSNMLDLPPNWMDDRQSATTIPQEVVSVLRGEQISTLTTIANSQEANSVFEPQVAPVTPSVQPPVSVAVPPIPDWMPEAAAPAAPAAVPQPTPVVTVKHPRRASIPQVAAAPVPPVVAAPVPPVAAAPVPPVAAAPVPPVAAAPVPPVAVLVNTGAARPVPPEPEASVFALRRDNLLILVAPKGARARLHKQLGVSAGLISNLASTDHLRHMSPGLARRIEAELGMSDNWMDAPHRKEDVPASAWSILNPEDTETKPPRVARVAKVTPPVAAPRPAPVAPVAAAAPTPTPAPVPPRAAPVAPVDLAAEEPRATRPPAPAPVAPAPRVTPVPRQAPDVGGRPVATAELPLQRLDAGVMQAGSLVFTPGSLPPLTEALMKLIVTRTTNGSFTERDAYRLIVVMEEANT